MYFPDVKHIKLCCYSSKYSFKNICTYVYLYMAVVQDYQLMSKKPRPTEIQSLCLRSLRKSVAGSGH